MRAPAIPLFPSRTLPSGSRILGPAGLAAACFAGCLVLALVAALTQAPERPLLPDVRPALAKLDEIEARAVATRTPPGECRNVLAEARRAQHGAIVFVKGDHCNIVRSFTKRPRRDDRR